MVGLIRHARSQGRRVLSTAGRLATRRVAVPAVAAATVVTGAVAAVFGAGVTDLLVLMTAGVVVAGVLHGHRQRRLILDELRRQAGEQRAGQSVAGMLGEVRDRQRLTALALGRLCEDLAESAADSRRLIRTAEERTGADLEALLYLYSLLAGGPPPPRLEPSGARATALLIDRVRTERPKLVVACGDAGQAVWCALVGAQFDVDARVVGLDHDADRAAAAERGLAALGLADRAEIRRVDLERYEAGGREVRWYPRGAWSDVVDVGVTAVATSGGDDDPLALPEVLGELLASRATVVLAGPAPDSPEVTVLAGKLSMRAEPVGPTTTVLTRG